MHYCNWNIADYASHTGHLSPLEDVAYRRCLDLYYLHEQPLPRDPKAVARDIRMREHEVEVRAVLAEFFDRTPRGYTNKRADQEIARYRAKVEAASNAGRTSAQRRFNDRSTNVERPLNGKATDVQPTNNQEPEPVPTPTPPAERGGGAEPSAAADPDPAIQLQFALEPTGYRSGIAIPLQRRFELARRAAELVATGLTPPDVSDLWDLAKAKTDGDPGALLAHWLDENLWREVLDEQRGKAKQRKAKTRAKVEADSDPLKGVYGA